MTPQQAFLLDQYFSLSLQAATQRASIWREQVSESQRKELHWHLRELLEGSLQQYATPVDDAAHTKTIERVANSLTRRHSGMLVGGRFRIGPAQKALNLYLKYLWCAGIIPMPPHCPIDAIVLRAIDVGYPLKWTQMYSTKQYAEVILKLKQIAGKTPLAEWELYEWARREA
jgi:hypothetical protein